MAKPRLRCRFAVSGESIRAHQCPNAVKGERVIVFDTKESLPACGVHLRARYANEYRARPNSKYDAPAKEEV